MGHNSSCPDLTFKIEIPSIHSQAKHQILQDASTYKTVLNSEFQRDTSTQNEEGSISQSNSCCGGRTQALLMPKLHGRAIWQAVLSVQSTCVPDSSRSPVHCKNRLRLKVKMDQQSRPPADSILDMMLKHL